MPKHGNVAGKLRIRKCMLEKPLGVHPNEKEGPKFISCGVLQIIFRGSWEHFGTLPAPIVDTLPISQENLIQSYQFTRKLPRIIIMFERNLLDDSNSGEWTTPESSATTSEIGLPSSYVRFNLLASLYNFDTWVSGHPKPDVSHYWWLHVQRLFRLFGFCSTLNLEISPIRRHQLKRVSFRPTTQSITR